MTLWSEGQYTGVFRQAPIQYSLYKNSFVALAGGWSLFRGCIRLVLDLLTLRLLFVYYRLPSPRAVVANGITRHPYRERAVKSLGSTRTVHVCLLTGCPELPRLSHYFLPMILLAEKRSV
jgi:hypothetical protein